MLLNFPPYLYIKELHKIKQMIGSLYPLAACNVYFRFPWRERGYMLVAIIITEKEILKIFNFFTSSYLWTQTEGLDQELGPNETTEGTHLK